MPTWVLVRPRTRSHVLARPRSVASGRTRVATLLGLLRDADPFPAEGWGHLVSQALCRRFLPDADSL